ncbi:hypothetical protein RJ641_015047 [Dillenia turbinata]|uniref:Uncharacterized protein n=1 Tax=Dillenia turbinata TaxID=194707 RepID=A0AAN8UVC9_9MAGN
MTSNATTQAFNLFLYPHPPSIFTSTKLTYPVNNLHVLRPPGRNFGLRLLFRPQAAISRRGQDAYDPELRSVLELASDSELYELENILYGRSLFSPLLKSMMHGADRDHLVLEDDLEERDNFIAELESRFLFLAADARSTLRGWRPSYRNVLLGVRKKLKVPCSCKLSTENLEAEIFLHLLQDSFSQEPGFLSRENSMTSRSDGCLELGISKWQGQPVHSLRIGAAELWSMVLKGGSLFTLGKLYDLVARSLTGKIFVEAANYQIRKEIIKKGGQLAAINLESRAALLAARQVIAFLGMNRVQVYAFIYLGMCYPKVLASVLRTIFTVLLATGFAGAASRYLGFRSMVTLLGPMSRLGSEGGSGSDIYSDRVGGSSESFSEKHEAITVLLDPNWSKRFWGTFLADVVIQMLGTDYARVLRAIYAFAQIRIIHTCRLQSDNKESSQ